MADADSVLLSVEDLEKTFRVRTGPFSRKRASVHAVRRVSFELSAGAALGIVGESGSGKTTIARMLIGLESPTAGRIVLEA